MGEGGHLIHAHLHIFYYGLDYLEEVDEVLQESRHFWILLQYARTHPECQKNMNARTDALFTVLKGHYVACACKILQLQDPTAKCPSVGQQVFDHRRCYSWLQRFMAPKMTHTTTLQFFATYS